MSSGFDDEELSMSLSNNGQSRPHAPTPRRTSQAAAERSRGADASKVTSRLPADRRTQQRIGLYDVKKTLGEGSFGKVKLATHTVTKQEVALKIISRKKLISRDMAGRVEREIQYLQLLRHPHIIKLYTVITTPTEIIMVLEYAGGELFDYLVKHGRMSENKARRFFQQIVCAVEYCHRHKIVHRDLKPENLLLDHNLNVKIADFGLSNIMTDGNFLKTSCGSPNYAAPEVISGKFYAGPEVDVWSCGVILYVLLVGRLPFDDDHIPNLFQKINSGNYHTPPWISSGAKNILHRMLKVNPVQRISVQEIRQDPWFNEGLESYLRQPVEEFIDTGVDPNKAIDPRQLAPGKPPAVQEQIHESVIGKLGKTMGYAKDDVQDALGKDEPNAIKDAYLIVRENQIMQTNPNLSGDVNPFLAMSPPTYDSYMPATPQSLAAHFATPTKHDPKPQSPADAKSPHNTSLLTPPRTDAADERSPTPTRRTLSVSPATKDISKPYVSKIGVLTSSLPVYHNAYMEARKKDMQRMYDCKDEKEDNGKTASLDLAPEPGSQSTEKQAEMMRHLKQHSRSTIQLQHITKQPLPQDANVGSDGKPRSGHRRAKWQFGIRSKNEPIDAVKCLYRALESMENCQWLVVPPKDDDRRGKGRPFPVNVLGATHISTHDHNLSESPEKDRQHIHFERGESNESDRRPSGGEGDEDADRFGDGESRFMQSAEERDEDVDPSVIPENYRPKDPWTIKVRWAHLGMAPPHTTESTSTQSSAVDLIASASDPSLNNNSDVGSRTASLTGSITQANVSATHTAASSSSNMNTSPPRTLGTDHTSSAAQRIFDRQINPIQPSSQPSSTLPSPFTSPTSFAPLDSSMHHSISIPQQYPSSETACFIYLDLQLYVVDTSSEVYLVDFKSAGYEPIIGERRVPVTSSRGNPGQGSEYKTEYIGSGRRAVELGDKFATSPQPFLDLASGLVVSLARGGG